MRILGNIIWLIFGGLESAIAYFVGSFIMAITIIGIPIARQTVKLGVLCLWPFGAEVKAKEDSMSFFNVALNVLWIIAGGFLAWLSHIFFGIILCITIIGIPFGLQHFKMSKLALAPCGKAVQYK